MEISDREKCPNCSDAISGRFCSNCGQSSGVGRITFKETLSDFFSASFALEGPLMHSLKMLVTNPGEMFRQYLSGKRRAYYKPVAFFILLTAIYLLVRSSLNYNPLGEQMADLDNPNDMDLTLIMEAGNFMFKNINNILFLLVLGIGLSLKLFFRKQYLLAEYVAIGFYMSGVYIIFGTLTMIWNHYTGFHLPSIHLLFLMAYIAISTISLFRPVSFGKIVKSLLTGGLSLLIYMILAFGLSLAIVWVR